MRSLWRMIASKWLGGKGSDALTGDSTLLDLLIEADRREATPVFQVRRESAVSHRAIMSRQDTHQDNGQDRGGFDLVSGGKSGDENRN
jgi:hypothetical protein